MKNKQAKTTNLLEIKKALNNSTTKDLINLVAELYSFSKANKEFLEARFLHSKNTIEHYKEKLQNYLAPDEPWKDIISIKEAK